MASMCHHPINKKMSGSGGRLSNGSHTSTSAASSAGAVATYAFASFEAFAQSQQPKQKSSQQHQHHQHQQKQQREPLTARTMLVQPPSMLRMESSSGSVVSDVSVNTMISRAAAVTATSHQRLPVGRWQHQEQQQANTASGADNHDDISLDEPTYHGNGKSSPKAEGVTTSWADYSYVNDMYTTCSLEQNNNIENVNTVDVDDNENVKLENKNPTADNDKKTSSHDDILYSLNNCLHRYYEDDNFLKDDLHGSSNNDTSPLFHYSAPVLTATPSFEFQSSENSLKRLMLLSNNYRNSCINLDQKRLNDGLKFVKEESGSRLHELDMQIKMMETKEASSSTRSLSHVPLDVPSSIFTFPKNSSSSRSQRACQYKKKNIKTLVDERHMPFEDACTWLSSSKQMPVLAQEKKVAASRPQQQQMLSAAGSGSNSNDYNSSPTITIPMQILPSTKNNILVSSGGGAHSYCSSITGTSGDTGSSGKRFALGQCRKSKRDLLLGEDPMPDDTKRRLLIGHPSLSTHDVSQRSLRPSLPSHASARRSAILSKSSPANENICTPCNGGGGGGGGGDRAKSSLSSLRQKQDFKSIMTLSKARLFGRRPGSSSVETNTGTGGKNTRQCQPQRLGRVDEKKTQSVTSNSSLPTRVSCNGSMMTSLPTLMSWGEPMMSVSEAESVSLSISQASQASANSHAVPNRQSKTHTKPLVQNCDRGMPSTGKDSERSSHFNHRHSGRRLLNAPGSIYIDGKSASKSSIISGITFDSSSVRSSLAMDVLQEAEHESGIPYSVSMHVAAASSGVDKTSSGDQETTTSGLPVLEASVGCVIHSRDGNCYRSSPSVSIDDCQKSFGNGEKVIVRGLRYYFETILLQGQTTQTIQCLHCHDLLEVEDTAELVYCSGCGELSPLAATPTLTLKECAEIIGMNKLDEVNRYLQNNQQKQRVLMMSLMQRGSVI